MEETIRTIRVGRYPTIATIVGAAIVCSLPAPNGRAANTEYSVGVAKVDITPDYSVRLHGFGGRRDESAGITQRIWAKALAIGADDEKPVILFTVDNLGTRMAVINEVAARLKQKAGIERNRIALTFTHSHTTPKTTGSADTIFSSPIPPEHQQRIDRYTAELTDALERVALDALANRQPATLEWVVGTVGFAKNRRTEGGPVDHDLPMLVVRSPAGEVRAIYVTYACHCVTLSDNKISGDWAGYAQEAIERNHPGAIALVSIGCGSDANPDSGVTGSNIAAAAEQGAQIANEVERLLRRPLKPLDGRITTQLRAIGLPLSEPPTRQELEQSAAENSPAGYNAKFQLAKLDRGEALQTQIDYAVQTFVIGDSLAMVFLAGEVCVDYSLRLKLELDADRVWLHGYANDFCCYIPSERLVREGGYGGGAETVYFALPATLKAGLEDKIIAEVRRQLPQQFLKIEQESRNASALEPTSPADALAAIKTHDDLVVELVAAEPLVADPVAIDFGADGRLVVAEMPDYSRGAEEKFDPSGRVKVLTDCDQDGRYDHATVLQGGLRFPTDVKVWRKGIIVCDAPDVIYLEDTDGDGDADVRRTLLTGFATHNAQARVNSLRWGLDNWVYGSCGLFGGRIRSFNGAELDLGGSDFRFRPDTGEIEPVTGNTQQGRTRDDWGNWFGCDSGSLCDHYPLSNHYLARNPHVVPPATEVAVPAGDDANQLFPLGQLVLFELSGAPGRPTAACGLEIYRDDLLGRGFLGNAFVAEPVNQLVHRRVLARHGTTFTGHRAENETREEFLASTDPWFRPVQIRTGLDGCLWIVDMCRYVIEHPRFIPQEALQSLNPMAGRGSGRILRVRPRNMPPRPALRLDELDMAGLVDALASINGPQRDLAQQLLIQRGDKSATPLLEKLASEADLPQARLQALCTLDGLAALRPEMLLAALSDTHPGVRSHAIRLSEPFLRDSPAIRAAVHGLVDDDEPQVQLQLAYTLGIVTDAQAGDALAALAWKHHADRYLWTAVMSSINPRNARSVLEAIFSGGQPHELPATLGEAVNMIATKVGDNACRHEALTQLSEPHDGGPSVSQLELLADVLEGTEHAPAVDHVTKLARQVVARRERNDRKTLAAIKILARTTDADTEVSQYLADMLGPQRSPEIQQAAVQLAAELGPAVAADLLLSHWAGYSPDVRAQVIDVFFSRDDMLPALLQGVAAGVVKPAHIDALERQRLLAHALPEIREAAADVFQGAINSDRKKVVESYADAVHSQGNVEHGRELFQKHCASCHRLEEHGFAVGPDLAALTSRTVTSLLESVLDPNRSIDERYQTYLAVNDDGRSFSGILLHETANSITLLEQQGKEHTLLRNALDEFTNTGQSLMPEGYERDLSSSDVADLLIYVVSCGAPPSDAIGARTVPVKVEPPAAADAASAIAKLVDGLAVGTPQEYERIPAIWEQALAAGKRNNTSELERLLLLSVPEINADAEHWQVVVLGGGVVNGLSMSGVWPGRRIEELLAGNKPLGERWDRLIELSAAMADDESVPEGTRYDALRLLGTESYESNGQRLAKYLKNDSVDLQMGAVSGLGDMEDERVAALLIECLGELAAVNRELAVGALLRTDGRIKALLAALEAMPDSMEWLTKEHKSKLLATKSETLRDRAKAILGEK
jgi:putative membrane-bound dehydrogenase-like protein